MSAINEPEAWDMTAWLEREEERHRQRLPKCSKCGEPIEQEDAVRFRGLWLCDFCLEDMREDIEEEEPWIE